MLRIIIIETNKLEQYSIIFWGNNKMKGLKTENKKIHMLNARDNIIMTVIINN